MSAQDSLKESCSLPVVLGREKQTLTVLTHRELKLTTKPTSICSINIYYQTEGPCIPKTAMYSSRMALYLIPAEPVKTTNRLSISIAMYRRFNFAKLFTSRHISLRFVVYTVF